MKQGTKMKIACLEEIALKFHCISHKQLSEQIAEMKGKYFEYLQKILNF